MACLRSPAQAILTDLTIHTFEDKVKYINVHNHNALHASTPQTEAHLCCTMSVVSAVVVVGHIVDTSKGGSSSYKDLDLPMSRDYI